jgi:two-component system, chemotaxis family, chemotaxis protein CheY
MTMDLKDRSVLVIDDYATMVRIVKRMCDEIGFGEIHTASDGEEGLAKLRDRHYDIAICDWKLEGFTGADVLAACKREPDLSRTALLMMGGDDTLLMARRLGVEGTLVKPFNTRILKDVVTAVLEKRAAAGSQTESALPR